MYNIMQTWGEILLFRPFLFMMYINLIQKQIIQSYKSDNLNFQEKYKF